MTRRALLVVCLVGCGDDRPILEQIEPVSGVRIKLEQFLYEDGTTQVDPSGFYDTRLHTRCAPRRWADDAMRCVPVASEAVYTDAACSEPVGVGAIDAKRQPTHFIGYDSLEGEPVPARLYRAGPATDPISAYYTRRDGACEGPVSAPSEVTYYTLIEEIEPAVMPVVDETELGAGRLGLRMLGTTDGLRVPVGLRDRVLDLACTPTLRGDGVACEPTMAAEPTLFADTACSAPAVVIGRDVAVPAVARVTDPTGCASYISVGDEVSPPLYRRDGDAGLRAAVVPGLRAFALGEPIELAWLARTVEDEDGDRRLARVTLHDPDDPALRFTGELLFDRAIRDQCRREIVGETVRCVPATMQPATTLYASGCGFAVQVAELPERTCSPVAFASAPSVDDTGITLHAIGDRVATTLYQFRAEGCVPYTPAPGRIVRALGPALPPETFVSAVKYGER